MHTRIVKTVKIATCITLEKIKKNFILLYDVKGYKLCKIHNKIH